MAIFVIGYKDNGFDERLVRLYNDKKKQIKDIKESDLLFLMEDINIVNAELKNKKLKGTTGSLDKVLNENFFVILGSIMQGNDIVAYRIVNSQGKDEIIDIKDIPSVFNKGIVQNASLVDEKYVRGINWEIPVIEELPKKKVPNDFIEQILFSNQELELIKKPRKGQVIMILDHFDKNSSMYVESRKLKVSLDSFYLRTTEDIFYKLLVKLSKYSSKLAQLDQNIIVDEKNFVIKVPTLTDIFKSDVEKMKEMCESLNAKLYLQPFLNFNFKNVSYKDSLNLDEMFISWGGFYREHNFDWTYWDITLDYVKENGLYSEEQIYDKGSIYNLYGWLSEIFYLYQKYLVYISKTYNLTLIMDKIDKPKKIRGSLGHSTLEIKTTGSTLIFQRSKSEIEKYTKNIADDVILLSLPDDAVMSCTFYDDLINNNQLLLDISNVPFYCYASEKIYFKIFEYIRHNIKLFDTVLEDIEFMGHIYMIEFKWPKKIQTEFLSLLSKIANELGLKVQIDLTNLSLEKSYNDIFDNFEKDTDDEKLNNIIYCLDGGEEASKFICSAVNNVMRELVKSLNKYPNIKVVGKTYRNSDFNYKCKLLECDDYNTICKIIVDLK